MSKTLTSSCSKAATCLALRGSNVVAPWRCAMPPFPFVPLGQADADLCRALSREDIRHRQRQEDGLCRGRQRRCNHFPAGNPTSSYLWRNIMPYCEGMGRLIACDLIGMGDSDKLDNSGPERYTYAEQCSYLFALWEQLALGDNIIMVLHDWGSAMGLDWANRNRCRVQGIAYMEAIVTPLTWADWPENAQRVFQGFRS